MQCDKGAIKHILSGSDIMCPGLTSPGGKMTEGLERGTVVSITAEGKKQPMGIGITVLGTDEIRKQNKDVGIELIQHLNDGLWKLTIPRFAPAKTKTE